MSESHIDRLVRGVQRHFDNPENPVFRALGIWLVDLLLDNDRYEIVFTGIGDSKVPTAMTSDQPFDLTKYGVVGDFLRNEVGLTSPLYELGPNADVELHGRYPDALAIAADALYDLIEHMQEGSVDDQGELDANVLAALDAAELSEYEFVNKFAVFSLQNVHGMYMRAALEARQHRREAKEQFINYQATFNRQMRLIGRDTAQQIADQTTGHSYSEENLNELLDVLDQVARATPDGTLRVAAALHIRPWPFEASARVILALQKRFALPSAFQ